MGRKKGRTDEPPRSSHKNLPDASVPFDSVFTGDIETKAGVRIDGRIKGNITAAGNVIIGSDGSVEGSVTGKDVNIAGSINGDVSAFGTVQMLAGSKLTGNLEAVSIAIETGAYLKGKCTITEKRKENANECLGKIGNKIQPKTEPAKQKPDRLKN